MPYKDKAKKRACAKRWHEANKEKKAAQDKIRNSRPANKEKHREQARVDYWKRHEKILATKRAEYSTDPAKLLKRAKLWRENNPEVYRQSTSRSYRKNKNWLKPSTKKRRAEYYRNNRESLSQKANERQVRDINKYRAQRSKSWHKRRATLLAKDQHFTDCQWLALKAIYANRCLRCGKQEPEILLTVDHVIPLCKGGSNTIDNIQPLCGTCNCIKARSIIDYRPIRNRSRSQRTTQDQQSLLLEFSGIPEQHGHMTRPRLA